MTPSKNSKPKALRRAVIERPDLPADPWSAPWERREPGPTQLSSLAPEGHRRRRHRAPRATSGPGESSSGD